MEKWNSRLLWNKVINSYHFFLQDWMGKESTRITGCGIVLSQRVISKIRIAMLQFTRRTKLSFL